MSDPETIRVLVIDDQESIHEDFRKIVRSEDATTRPSTRRRRRCSATWPSSSEPAEKFEIDSAHQGEEGLAMVRAGAARQPPLPAGVRRRPHAAGLGRRRNHPTHLAGGPGNPHRALHGLLRPHLGGNRRPARTDRPPPDPEEAVRQHRSPPNGAGADQALASGPPGGNDAKPAGTEGRRADPRGRGPQPGPGAGHRGTASHQRAARRRASRRRGRQPGQDRVPRQHESRNPHAHDRHRRLCGTAARRDHQGGDPGRYRWSSSTPFSATPNICWDCSTTSST